MKSNVEKTKKLLLEHFDNYPRLQIADLFKYIHQSAFGCEHMVSSEEFAIEYIRKEYNALTVKSAREVEMLDGEYRRVHLSIIDGGLSPETLGKLFCLSAKKEPLGNEALHEKLEAAKELISEGKLPFDIYNFTHAESQWEAEGYPALHHSHSFRLAYSPAYRVIAEEYVKLLPMLSMIDKALSRGTLTIAIEGGSASGKSTLGELLKRLYGCNLFHMDDFFLRPEQRTAERFAEAGGNVDRERFLSEVLLPTSRKETVNYRRFDCSSQTVLPPVSVAPKKLTVIEGAYSMHPDLAPYYDFGVFLDIGKEYQRERISKRNTPEFAKRFFNEWIPLEEKYFSQMNVKERCALTIPITKN